MAEAARAGEEREEETMIGKLCPLLYMFYHSRPVGGAPSYCLEEDCAWWNEDFDCCGLIAQGVIWGLETARKESHEGQEH